MLLAPQLQVGDETKIQVPDRPDAEEPRKPAPAAPKAAPVAPATAAARAAPPAVDAGAAAAAEAKRKAAVEEAKAKLQKEQVGFGVCWELESQGLHLSTEVPEVQHMQLQLVCLLYCVCQTHNSASR